MRAWVLPLLLLVACKEEPPPALPAADAGESAMDASGPLDTGIADSGIAPRDSGTIADECDPVQQTGCTPPRDRCVVENAVPNGGTQCVSPTAMDKAFGEACQGGDCAAALSCVNTTGGPICRQLCDRRDGAGCERLGADWDCREQLRGTNWGACTRLPPTCDPFTAMSCGAGEGCYPLRRRNGTFELRCGAAGNRTHGQSCDDAQLRCAAGHVCVRSASSGLVECRKLCQGDGDCAALPMGSTCAGAIQDLAVQYCHP